MPINLELKIHLDNPAPVMENIRLIKAEKKGDLNQVDVYYKYKNGLLKLRTENGIRTLIKYNRNEKTGSRWSDYEVIPMEENPTITKMKDYNLEDVFDGGILKKLGNSFQDQEQSSFRDIPLLTALGALETETVVEKHRQLYLYDNTRIHLDEVKGLGSFLELETLVINGKEDAEKRFKEIIKLLGLKTENEIRKSYRDLMLEKTEE